VPLKPWSIRKELRPPGVPRRAVATETVACLRCPRSFESPDRKRVRICPICKESAGRLSRREAEGPAGFAEVRASVPDLDAGF